MSVRYVTLSNDQRRRLNDNGSFYARPGKAEIKRRKKARQAARRRKVLRELNAVIQRSGRGVRGTSEGTAAPDA